MDVRRRLPASVHEETRSVLSAAISRFVESANTGKPAPRQAAGPDFVAADRFDGPKQGFFFTTGSKGTGYYIDPKSTHEKKLSKEDAGAKGSDAKPKPAVDAKVLLKNAEEQAKSSEPLDGKAVRRLVLAFERKYKENLEQRMKYADQPERFMDSEVDLDQCVQAFLQLVNNPDLYPVFVEANAVPHLLNLLTHENTDISIDVVDLLQALTDTEDNEEWVAEFRTLVSSMIDNNALELLVQRLGQLNESSEEEASAVFNILGIVENMIDVMPEVSKLVVERKILRWMLLRLRPREFDSIKQYVAELLAVLMQGGEANLRAMGETGGIDCLLEGVALFKSRDPQTEDETEFLENMFDALCSCMLLPENRAKFVESEGLELMLLILKQKKIARYGAIKVCGCAGLEDIVRSFHGKNKDREKDQKAEEELVTIIANLFQEIMKGSRRDRVAAKFVENEFEKCDRLIEVYFSYHARLSAEEARLAELKDPVDDEEAMVSRLNSGLSVLQQVCLIISHLWSIGDAALNRRLLLLLHQKGHALAHPRAIVDEMIDMIGGEGLEREQQQQRLCQLLIGLGGTKEEATKKGSLPEAVEPAPEPHTEAIDRDVSNEANAKTKDSKKKESVQHRTSTAASAPSKDTERPRESRKRNGAEKYEKERDRDREREREKQRERERERDKEKERDRERDRRHERDYRRDRHKEKDSHHHRDKRRRSDRDDVKRDRRD